MLFCVGLITALVGSMQPGRHGFDPPVRATFIISVICSRYLFIHGTENYSVSFTFESYIP